MKSSTLNGQLYDYLSGSMLPPAEQPTYTWNSSLWYDDGRLSMRLAVQVNSDIFMRYQLRSAQPFPANGAGQTSVTLPLLPPTLYFRDMRRFVDGRIAYKFGNGLEVFLEGRNLGNETVSNSNGDYAQYSDGRGRLETSYSGRRFLAGVIFRN
jgi:hypothetical protein